MEFQSETRRIDGANRSIVGSTGTVLCFNPSPVDFGNVAWPTSITSCGPPIGPGVGTLGLKQSQADQEGPAWVGEPQWSYSNRSDVSTSSASAPSKASPPSSAFIAVWSVRPSAALFPPSERASH